MKRKILFLGLTLMVSMAANAQEVIFKRLDHYYDNCWTFDTCQNYESYMQSSSSWMLPTRYGLFKRAIFDEKPYTVYGIAICTQVDTCFCRTGGVASHWQNNVEYPVTDSAYLRVQMRRYDNGAMSLVAETILHPFDSIPRYYLMGAQGHLYDMPIYEAYFSEGIPVSGDTMYAGYFIPQPEEPLGYHSVNGNWVMNWHRWPIDFVDIVRINNTADTFRVDTATKGMYMFMDTIGGEWISRRLTSTYDYSYIFPIIAPYSPYTPPQQGVVESHEEVKVLLSPNPASQVAGVSASAVIERLEVYNAAGEKVYESQPGYVLAFLDVSQWPSGVYLLRIHTPQGETTKKLVVR